MRISQKVTDNMSIGLSMLCAIHCLALPVILALLPSLGALQLQNEAFHTWMLVAVIPISLYALTMGCKKHRSYGLLLLGSSGLLLLILAVLLGHDIAGQLGEKMLTVLGSMIIVLAHWKNFRLCKNHINCAKP